MFENYLSILKIERSSRQQQPDAVRTLAATALSILGSLVADAILVAIGQRAFPSTKGYTHFQFADYSKLTIVGVVIACAAWPVVTRICKEPKWLFLRLAIAVTLVLLLPDLYILHQGQPVEAVEILMLMHVAIAIVTYTCLTRIAPARYVHMRHARGEVQ